MTTKEAILNAWYDEVWAQGNTASIPKFMSTNAEARGIIPDLTVDQNEFSVLVETIRKMIDTFVISIPIAIDQGDWLAAVVKVKARNIRTGGDVHAMGQVMARFEGEKMVEVYNSFDFLTLFEQLGQLPENTLALLLSGTDFN